MPKQFCLRGHDTLNTGRTCKGQCRVCKRDEDTARYRALGGHNAARRRRGRVRQGIVDLPLSEPPAGSPCDCCGKTVPGPHSADHCHASGRFRGWVCRRCNTGFGYLEDPDWLTAAAIFLLKHMK